MSGSTRASVSFSKIAETTLGTEEVSSSTQTFEGYYRAGRHRKKVTRTAAGIMKDKSTISRLPSPLKGLMNEYTGFDHLSAPIYRADTLACWPLR